METSLDEFAGADKTEGSFSGFRSFRLNEFEGPLDLLLFLIKKNEINIYDIPIAKITEQYLDYLADLTELNLDEISEFQTEAASLLLIKSRMLLPVELKTDDDEEDTGVFWNVSSLVYYENWRKS